MDRILTMSCKVGARSVVRKAPEASVPAAWTRGPSGAVRPPRRLGKLVSDSDSPGNSLVRCFGIAQLLNLFLQTVQPDTTTPVPPWATEGGSFRNPASGPRT
jgi:hypothetical protein